MLVKIAPATLALHLKRFKYVESLGRHSKLMHRVAFPDELKLNNLSEDAPEEAPRRELSSLRGGGPRGKWTESWTLRVPRAVARAVADVRRRRGPSRRRRN